MNKKTASVALVLALVAGAFGVRSLRSSSDVGSASGEQAAQAKESGGAAGAASAGSVKAGSRDLHLGAQFAYEVKVDRVYADAAGKPLTSQSVAGRLVLTVVGQKEGGAAVRAVLDGASDKELAAPFFFVLAPDGRVTSYGFAKSIPGEARGQLRAIVASLQLAPETVERVEGDVSGEALASYVRSGEGVVRTKVRYDRVRTAAGLVAPGEIGGQYQVASKGVFVVDASGWPASLDEQEKLAAVFSQGSMTMVAKTTAKLVGKSEDKSLAGSYAAAEPGFDADVDAIGQAAKLARENADKGLVKGATFKELASDLESSKDGRERARTIARMGALFRTSPESIGEARAKLLQKGGDEQNAKAIAGALGAGGSPEAQRALRDALASSDTTSGVKVASAISLGLVSQPTTEAKEALSSAARSADGDVASTSTLALGNLARSAGDSANDVVDALLAKLEAATNEHDKAQLVDALGNSGSPRALDAILGRTSDTSTLVRTAACGALKFQREDRAVKALTTCMFDSEGTVRRSALAAVGQQDLGPFVETFQTFLEHEQDAELRVLAVRTLARALNALPAVEGVLSWASQHDKDAKVREAATQALSKPKR